jgi:hypothetical protein
MSFSSPRHSDLLWSAKPMFLKKLSAKELDALADFLLFLA